MDNVGEVAVKRGEVYWFKMGDAIGSEQTLTRPGVILSSESGCTSSDVLTIAYLTTKDKVANVTHIRTMATGRQSWVLCEQITTVSKLRLSTYLGVLDEYEMEAVEKGVCTVLGINLQPQDSEEKKNMALEIARLKAQLAQQEDKKTDEALERDMYKRMYDKALDAAVSAQIRYDLLRKSTPTETPEPEAKPQEAKPQEENTPTETPEPEEELIDINTCTGAELRKAGFQPGQIKHVIDHRPYKSVEDLRFVPMINKFSYAILKNRVRCVPVVEKPKVVAPKVEKPKVEETPVVEPVVEPKVESSPVVEKKVDKVNVNEASVEDLVKIVGMGESLANRVISYRRSVGCFKKLKDLLAVPYFGEMWLKKYAPMLEV